MQTGVATITAQLKIKLNETSWIPVSMRCDIWTSAFSCCLDIWRSVKCSDTDTVCSLLFVCTLVFIVKWAELRSAAVTVVATAAAEKLKARNERSTQVAISIIKAQKWRGGSEEGWKEMICSINPNWITAITSLFLSLALLYIFFLISFQTVLPAWSS